MAITFGDRNRSQAARLAGTGGTINRVGVNINGMKELQNFLARFPQVLNTNKNKERIFRKNSKILQDQIKSNISKTKFKDGTSGSRQLEQSIGFITTARSRAIGGGYVGLRVRGAYKNKEKSGFYGAWIEVGKDAQNPTYKWGPAKPFIEPAYKTTKKQMMSNMLKDARTIMYKEVKKLRKEGTAAYR
jgi:hypothetical protein